MTFCSSGRPGSRLGNWKTKPMVRLRRLLRSASVMPHRSTPSTVTVPLVGVARPAAMLSSVVLPQPERPVMTRKSLTAMSRSTSRSAANVAAPLSP